MGTALAVNERTVNVTKIPIHYSPYVLSFIPTTKGPQLPTAVAMVVRKQYVSRSRFAESGHVALFEKIVGPGG